MEHETGLTQRDLDILQSVVKTYIDTGEPVASRTLSKRRKDLLSAATIRNVMADLADLGYLSQPHTSAGRVPTEQAFRHYARSVTASRMSVSDIDRVTSELRGADTLEGRIERSSHVLMELTHNLGIAAAIPASSHTLDQVELLALADRRVLMIVVTRDHVVRNRVVNMDGELTQDDLNSIRNYINRNFSGWVLSTARQELARRLEQASAAYDEIMRRLIVLYANGLLDDETAPEVHAEGVSNLVGWEFKLTREKTRELFRALEEKKKILYLLDHFLEGPEGQVTVRVGLEEAHPAMRELSLIGLIVALPGGLSARIAVVGPMRMQYEKVMSAVLHVGRAFQALPS